MKLAIIGSRGYPYVYSGYETFVKELSERLVQKGIKVTVYCHRNLFEQRPKRVNGIDLIYLPAIERKSLSQFTHSLQAMCHACFKDFDAILVVNSANGPFGAISKLLRKKTLINVDGLEWLRPKWKGLGSKYFYTASKLATKLYDIIICDSFEMSKIYKKEFNAESAVIAYGANIRYSNNPELISKWNLRKDNYYLIVGRLIPDNNADLIIKGFLSSNSKKKLVIVGDVPYNDEYAQNLKSMKDERLLFTGYITDQDELAELYHNCFAYFHGHEFGGTNPTLLKALAYGCAVLALDTPFSRETLDNDKHGLFFDKNSASCKELIERAEKSVDIIMALKENSRSRIIENYTWEKITEEYIKVLK